MSRSNNRLTVRQVATVNAPGHYDDGEGLYLSIASDGSRSWFFMDADQVSEIDLGDAASISLTIARRLAVDTRYALAAGQDPRAMLRLTMPAEQGTIPTFGAFVQSYITSTDSGFMNPRYHREWRNSLYTYAKPLLSKPIDEIGTDDVLAVLKPIWPRLPQTARRLRGKIEKVFEAAQAHGFRPKDVKNPAAWRGNLVHLLPAPPPLAISRHPALSWDEAPAFIAELRSRQALAARCLEIVILTAAPSGKVLGLTWGEINWESKLWSIPANSSAAVNHVVPLSAVAVALLDDLRPEISHADMRVFSYEGKPFSNKAMVMLIRRMKRDSITVHGFRYTFKEWAAKATDFPRELVDEVLAGGVINSKRVSGSGATIELRRQLMEAWSEFLGSQSA